MGEAKNPYLMVLDVRNRHMCSEDGPEQICVNHEQQWRGQSDQKLNIEGNLPSSLRSD
jgi:hypothetical protein